MGEFAKPFPASSRLDSIHTAPSRTLRVLVADDHEMVRLGLCALLQSQQIEICAQAKNGEEAVEKSRQLSPDLIVLDISMPVLGGIEAARQIRVFLPDVPILFFSTHNASHLVAIAKSVGAQGSDKKKKLAATRREELCVEKNKIGTSGRNTLICRAASMPPRTGIEMSRTIKSGLNCLDFSTASSPFFAWAHISICWD